MRDGILVCLSCGVTIDSGVGRGFADYLKSKTAPMPTDDGSGR